VRTCDPKATTIASGKPGSLGKGALLEQQQKWFHTRVGAAFRKSNMESASAVFNVVATVASYASLSPLAPIAEPIAVIASLGSVAADCGSGSDMCGVSLFLAGATVAGPLARGGLGTAIPLLGRNSEWIEAGGNVAGYVGGTGVFSWQFVQAGGGGI
jgi:hypothetical protein